MAALAAAAATSPPCALALEAGFGKGPSYCAWYGNTASRYSFDDVYACSSTHSAGSTPFDADGDQSFQCVELAARFLWAIYGIWAGPGSGVQDGADFVAVVHRLRPSIARTDPAPGRMPAPGDIVSLGPGGAVDATFGHVAIVISVSLRRHSFEILGQNFPPGRAGEQTASVDESGGHNGEVRIDGVWTRATWLELRRPRRRRGHRGSTPRGRERAA